MGGAGYIFTGEHDAAVMHNSATINLNVLECGRQAGVKSFFYSSSACIYPEHNQLDPAEPNMLRRIRLPAAPDSEYGWEKLFSERLYLSYMRNYSTEVHIARFHNIFGPKARGEEDGRGASGHLPKGGRSTRRRRHRNLGRWQRNAVVPICR